MKILIIQMIKKNQMNVKIKGFMSKIVYLSSFFFSQYLSDK